LAVAAELHEDNREESVVRIKAEASPAVADWDYWR